MTLTELETIYQQEYSNLVKIARNQLRKTPVMIRSEEPEDIVQAVFAHLLESPELGEDPRYMTLTGGENFAGYLRDAVLTRVFNLVRRGVSIRSKHDDMVTERTVQPQDYSLHQLFDQVVDDVSNPKVRELLRLVVLEGWKPKKAATHTGLNYNYARSCIKRMREEMRERLNSED